MAIHLIQKVPGSAGRLGLYSCSCGNMFKTYISSVKRDKWSECGCGDIQIGDQQEGFTITEQSEDMTSRATRGAFTMVCVCGLEETVAAKTWNNHFKRTHWCPESSGMIGKVFERLTVVEYEGKSTYGHIWKCLCECGEFKSTNTVSLKRGNTQSCGCLHREIAADRARNGYPVAEVPGYMGMHHRIRKARGSASEHSCIVCGAQANDWAYDGLDPDEHVNRFAPNGMGYSIKLEHYNPMCDPCHATHDSEFRAKSA